MSTVQVTDAHQELANDLTAGKAERFLKSFTHSVLLQQIFEAAVFTLKPDIVSGIRYRSIDLKPVLDNAGIVHQTYAVSFPIRSNFADAEVVVSVSIRFLF